LAHRSTTKTERSDVDYPLWRKKVDNTVFRDGVTPIPDWASRMWNLRDHFPHKLSKRDPHSKVSIMFSGSTFEGNISTVKSKSSDRRPFRFHFGGKLCLKLKEVFLMSYMRDLESRLSDASANIEKDIPFWEFLDIEFDDTNKSFHLTAHYTQQPTFPELFKRITYSPVLTRIDEEVNGKSGFRISKQGWLPRSNYKGEGDVENVIYMLADTKNKLAYIGEAKHLVRRFNQGHDAILGWDYYRYDMLPPMNRETRVALERMMIRAFASVIPNSRVRSLDMSDWRLVNKKIDD
jgi:hypothetical protein